MASSLGRLHWRSLNNTAGGREARLEIAMNKGIGRFYDVGAVYSCLRIGGSGTL